MPKSARLSPEAREAQRDAAYERGWVDSLRAYWAISLQPIDDCFDYGKGWNACAKYRWADPSNNGRAPDPDFRVPRNAQT